MMKTQVIDLCQEKNSKKVTDAPLCETGYIHTLIKPDHHFDKFDRNEKYSISTGQGGALMNVLSVLSW